MFSESWGVLARMDRQVSWGMEGVGWVRRRWRRGWMRDGGWYRGRSRFRFLRMGSGAAFFEESKFE